MGQNGIYTDIGGLSVVADLNTAIPGGSGNFTGPFRRPSLDDGHVAFWGRGSGQAGIYTDIGGLAVVADLNASIPGGLGNFTGFGNSPSFDGGNVAFRVVGLDQEGIYTDIGGLGVVADRNTAVPDGSGNFVDFVSSEPSLDDGNVAFFGYASGQEGIYTDIGGLAVVADRNTAVPGGSGDFAAFDIILSLDGGNVAFTAGSSGQQGIYTDIGGLTVVADLNTAIPGGLGNFVGMGLPSIDGGNVAYWGSGSGGQVGIYVAFQEHRWKTGASGSWDDETNWSFRTLPRDVVPTVINPGNSVNVAGPTGNTTVRSLTVGGGAGEVMLSLDPAGSLAVEEFLLVDVGGTLGGSGQIGGDVFVQGTVSPGTSAGKLDIDGNYLQLGSGTLAVEIGGLAPGSGYDQLNATGNATLLNGTLDVSLIDAFVPSVPDPIDGGDGDSFAILTAAQVSGRFGTIIGLDYDNALETGRELRLSRTSTDVTVTAFQAAYGDGNMDRQLDSGDLFAMLGAGKFNAGPSNATWLEGDFNNDDEVNSTDLFLILATGKFFQGPYSSAVARVQVVPEPSTFALAAAGLLAILIGAGNQRRRTRLERSSS